MYHPLAPLGVPGESETLGAAGPVASNMKLGEVPAELLRPALSVQVEEKDNPVPSGTGIVGDWSTCDSSGDRLSWRCDDE